MAEFTASAPRIGKLFSLPGDREMVDQDKAYELLKAATVEFQDFEKICLTNKSFSREAARVMAEALASFPSIVDADLADIIAGRPEEEALEVLSTICMPLSAYSLTAVDLSDNALGSKGVNACRAALAGHPLRSVKLCNNGLSEASMEEVKDLLTAGGPTLLETVHFYNNMSGDGGAISCAALLAQCPALTDFRFSGTRALRPGSLAVATALQSCHGLVRLDLADTLFAGAAAAAALARALGAMPALRRANLRDTQLGAEGAPAVLGALAAGCPRLEFLDVSGCELTAETALPLVRLAAARAATLHTLLAEDNDEFGPGGAHALALWGAAAARAQARAPNPAPAPALRRLALTAAGLTGPAALALARRLPAGCRLGLDQNFLGGAALAELAEVLGDRLEPVEDDEGEGEDGDADEDAGAVGAGGGALSEGDRAVVDELTALFAAAAAEAAAVGGGDGAAGGLTFALAGEREMVDEARARALVAAALGAAPGGAAAFARVDLANKSFSAGAAAVLAEALAGMANVREAGLADMIAGRPEGEALAALGAVCGALRGRPLTAVDLSDNALGQKGVRACRAVLEGQAELRSLRLCNNGLSAAAMEEVADLLLFRTPTRLATLHFHNNMSGDGGARALARVLAHCPALADLRFSGTRAGREGSRAVARALAAGPPGGFPALTALDLADNAFAGGGEGEGGAALAAALRGLPALRRLGLRDCALEGEAAGEVAAALAAGPAGTLLWLDLSGNELPPAAGPALAALAAAAPRLEELLLEDNCELGEEGGLVPLANALAAGALPALRSLQLAGCGVRGPMALSLVHSLEGRKLSTPGGLGLNENAISEGHLEQLQSLVDTLFGPGVLGPMDDNDAEAGEDEEDFGDQELTDLLASKLNLG